MRHFSGKTEVPQNKYTREKIMLESRARRDAIILVAQIAWARSPSGKAKVCKTFTEGSIPSRASSDLSMHFLKFEKSWVWFWFVPGRAKSG
jgi:hypothetical protein